MKLLSCFRRCGQPRVRREPSFSSNCQTSSSLAPDCGKSPEKSADCDRLVTLNQTSAGVAVEFFNCASPFRSTYIEAIADTSILKKTQRIRRPALPDASYNLRMLATRAALRHCDAHLEGHILPAGLDISSLHLLLDSDAQTSSQGLHQTCSASGHTSNTLCPGAPCPVSLDSLQTRPQLQHAPRPGAASHDAVPDLRQLSPEQLVRLCLPEELIHDLAGLTVIGRGSQSATCSALWRGARVAVKFTASVSLLPTRDANSSAIIRQALVSKALAHPNVLQHFSVRCCRLKLPPPTTSPHSNDGSGWTDAAAASKKAVVATKTTTCPAVAPATTVKATTATDTGVGIHAPMSVSAPNCLGAHIAHTAGPLFATPFLHHLSAPAPGVHYPRRDTCGREPSGGSAAAADASTNATAATATASGGSFGSGDVGSSGRPGILPSYVVQDLAPGPGAATHSSRRLSMSNPAVPQNTQHYEEYCYRRKQHWPPQSQPQPLAIPDPLQVRSELGSRRILRPPPHVGQLSTTTKLNGSSDGAGGVTDGPHTRPAVMCGHVAAASLGGESVSFLHRFAAAAAAASQRQQVLAAAGDGGQGAPGAVKSAETEKGLVVHAPATISGTEDLPQPNNAVAGAAATRYAVEGTSTDGSCTHGTVAATLSTATTAATAVAVTGDGIVMSTEASGADGPVTSPCGRVVTTTTSGGTSPHGSNPSRVGGGGSAGSGGDGGSGGGAGDMSCGSQSFNSCEGFGNPFGNSLRHTLSLAHVAALVCAREGEYLTAIIMEHADKSTLQHAIHRGVFQPGKVWSGRVAARALLRTALEVAFALQHLHSRDVVHGALCPQNVLLRSSNIDRRGFTAKVSNFSLARVCCSTDGGEPYGMMAAVHPGRQLNADKDQTSGGGGGAAPGDAVSAAALPYLAPEQLLGVMGKPSDVYAFGILFHVMITGAPPHSDLSFREVQEGVLAGRVLPCGSSGDPASAPSLLPDQVRELCVSCCRTDPLSRPPFSTVCSTLQAAEHVLRQQLRH